MIQGTLGLGLLIYTLHKLREQTADPFWFCAFSNLFEVTRTKRPVIHWTVIASEIVFSLAILTYGVFKLI